MNLKTLAIYMTLILCAPLAVADSLRDAFDHYKRNPAGSFKSEEMKGWTGPSFHARNNLVEPKLVAIQPPAWNAGCAGIDFWAGSFSLVTKEELVQMFRGIAAGAPGYFFNVAMGAVCATCAQEMKDLQEKLESYNALTRDACTRAWDKVEETTNLKKNTKAKANVIGTSLDSLNGNIPDWGQFIDSSTKTNPSEAEATAANDNLLGTHIKNNIGRIESIAFPDDVTERELYMSVFGTTIIQGRKNADGKWEQHVKDKEPTFNFQKALYNEEGDTITFWKCKDPADDPMCLEPFKKDIPFEGLVTKYKRLITNRSTENDKLGIYQKMMGDIAMSEEQALLISNTRYSYEQTFKNLLLNPDTIQLIPAAGEHLAMQVSKDSLANFYENMANELKKTMKNSAELTPAAQKNIEDAIEAQDRSYKSAIDMVETDMAKISRGLEFFSNLKHLSSK